MQPVAIYGVLAAAMALAGMAGIGLADEPVPIAVGAGSYASFPPAHEGEGVSQMLHNVTYVTAPNERPLPSNDWWTDLIVSRYAGQMWALPLVVSASAQGANFYTPREWSTDGGSMQLNASLKVGAVVVPQPGTTDVLIADFEGSTYAPGWQTTGSAFGTGPAAGTLAGQGTVSGYIGNGLVNSFLGGDSPTGTLVSPAIVVTRSNLCFLVGGGNYPGTAEVRFVVAAAPVRTATGVNAETMTWATFDLTPWLGATGRVEIIDFARGSWGHILADHFLLTNDPVDPGARWSSLLAPVDARAADWSDWLVRMRMAQDAVRFVDVTFGHGLPFAWLEFNHAQPRVTAPSTARFFSPAGDVTAFPYTNDMLGIAYAGRAFALYAPDATVFARSGTTLTLGNGITNTYLVVGVLPAESELARFRDYAYAMPRTSTVMWTYDPRAAAVQTTWTLQTEPLKGNTRVALQGWLPHHYRGSTHALPLLELNYPTPRGILKCATGTVFRLTYPFNGLLPMLPPPHDLHTGTNDYDPERMALYIAMYSTRTGFNADTYWSGKDVMQYGEYMAFAAALAQPGFAALKNTLRGGLENWFTYSPPETKRYFAWYPNWRALVGFNESYGSYAFNDHHFHYGYFTTATALLGMYDDAFLQEYGPLATLVAREYANWDRHDTNLPFLRTFDPWSGHAYAAGLSSPNGNNQESSSEAMQSWGGLFMLGAMLNDTNMLAAGAMGYAMESAAVDEYWLDYYRYAGPPGAGNFPTNYTKTVAGILFDYGQVFATYFDADPGWIHGIQWLPISPFMSHLVRDPAFAQWQFDHMMSKRAAYVAPATNTFSSMGADLGNVVLGYAQLFNATGTAAHLDALWNANDPVANNNNTAGITYYNTHANRMLGPLCWDWHTSIPTSQVFSNAASGELSCVIYNPRTNACLAEIYHTNVLVGYVAVPAKTLLRATSYTPVCTSFAVLTSHPANGAVAVPTTLSDIAVAFSMNVNAATLGGATLAGPGVSGMSYAAGHGSQLITFSMAGAVQTGATYLVTIPAGVTSLDGTATLGSNVYIHFTIAARAPGYDILAGHFRLDETSGTTAMDASPQQGHGVYTNSPLLGRAGAHMDTGYAVALDGLDDHAVLARPSRYGLNGNFTAVAWVNLASTVGDQPLIGTDGFSTGKGLHLVVRNGKPYFGFYDSDTLGTRTLVTGRWYHLAFRFRNGEQAVFVNGARDAVTSNHITFAGLTPVLLGRWGADAGTPRMLNGRLDDVQFYTCALSDFAVQYLYLNPGQTLPPVFAMNDSDGDGMPDTWESAFCGNPTNFPAYGDSDGDTALNLLEYLADTDPTNAASVLCVTAVTVAHPGGVMISVPSSAAREYRLQAAPSLVGGNEPWQNIGAAVAGNNGVLHFADGGDATQHYYRVHVRLPSP